MSKLKPCPFCGETQELIENPPYIYCMGCGAKSTDWQTRPIEDAQSAEIERLKIENARMREVLLICANENASEWDCCGTRRYHKRLAIKALKGEG